MDPNQNGSATVQIKDQDQYGSATVWITDPDQYGSLRYKLRVRISMNLLRYITDPDQYGSATVWIASQGQNGYAPVKIPNQNKNGSARYYLWIQIQRDPPLINWGSGSSGYNLEIANMHQNRFAPVLVYASGS